MSSFISCQEEDCENDAEYRCSCRSLFCNNHYQRHSVKDGSGHQHKTVLLPLERDELDKLRKMDTQMITIGLLEKELQKKIEKERSLYDQIRIIETDYASTIQNILEAKKEFKAMLSEIEFKRKFPLIYQNPWATPSHDLTDQKDFCRQKFDELYEEMFSAIKDDAQQLRSKRLSFQNVDRSENPRMNEEFKENLEESEEDENYWNCYICHYANQNEEYMCLNYGNINYEQYEKLNHVKIESSPLGSEASEDPDDMFEFP